MKDLFENLPLNLEVFSVSSLRDRLNSVIKENFPQEFILKGVISSTPKLYPSFVYFDIKDEDKNMSFTVSGFIGNFYKIEKKLKDIGIVDSLTTNIPVMLILSPVVSTQKQISFRLNLIDIIPEYTKSKLASEKDLTIKKLTEENLITLQKELILPKLIQKIGLITSEQGTSIKDITSAMGESIKHFDIIFQAVRVEGKEAVSSIKNAIKLFNKHQNTLSIDLLIIARGGGSSVDLSCFNSYELCKEVCKSKIPIITAIGHDTDEHAIELCSYYTPSPSTPSGIGTFIKNTVLTNKEQFKKAIESILDNIKDRFKEEKINILNVIKIIKNTNSKVIEINFLKVENSFRNILKLIKDSLNNQDKIIENILKLIKAYNPKEILKRGYTLVFSEENKLIKKKTDLTDKAVIEFCDGLVKIERREL